MPGGALHDVPAVGVDGCPAGWLVAGLDGDDWHLETIDDVARLPDDGPADRTVLVDIPIGLPESSVRECDERARSLLGCRGSSVFRTPVRAAVAVKARAMGFAPDEGRGKSGTDGRSGSATGDESDGNLRERAADVNEAATGYRISVQTWNIVDRIAAVDARLDDPFAADQRVRECHPELCFMAMNGQPLAYAKGSDRGRAQRLHLLEREAPGARAAFEAARASVDRRDASDDDLLDAMALGRAARHGIEELETVPADPGEGQPRIYFPPYSFLSDGGSR